MGFLLWIAFFSHEVYGANLSNLNRYISDKNVKFTEQGVGPLPNGYRFEVDRNEVKSDSYLLKFEKSPEGILASIKEVKKTKLEAGVDEKSKDSYEYTSTSFDGNGKPATRTLCKANRSLSTLSAFFGISGSGSKLFSSNQRNIECRTLTEDVCKEINDKIRTEFGDYSGKAKEFVTTCNAYSEKFSKILIGAYEKYPEGMLRRETDSAKALLSSEMGSYNLDFGLVNLTQVLAEVPAQKRVEDVRSGFLALNEMMSISDACAAESVRLPEWGLPNKASETKRTAPAAK